MNSKETIKFKAKDSEIVPYSLCLGNISKDWTDNNMKKKQGLMVTYMILVLIIIPLISMIY